MPELPLRPLFDRVLLHREQRSQIGSVIIPETVAKRNAPNRGVCVAKGGAADPAIEIGKTYIHGQHAGTWINAEGVAVPDPEEAEYFVVVDTDLIAEVVSNG